MTGRGADVVALGRPGTDTSKINKLKELGASISVIDMFRSPELERACKGASCVVSALAGLWDVIVEAQSVLLEAAVAAGVSKFIPSDFSIDFTALTPGENRNFDLRREFQRRLDAKPILATSIYNGAFAEVLTYSSPLLDFKQRTIGYWNDPDWSIDFTSMNDAAAFTAAAALDARTPRALHIASFQVSANDLCAFTKVAFGKSFGLVRLGGIEDLRAYNKRERAAHPEGEQVLYASWQQSQYMQSMFSAHHQTIDNQMYSDLIWSRLEDVLARTPRED